MKRTLAITAAAVLALSLAACGAENGGTMLPEDDSAYGSGVVQGDDLTNTGDTMDGTAWNDGRNGTANGTTWNGGLGDVAGAVNGGWSGRAAKDDPAALNGGVTPRTERDAQASADRYALMLENGRVHDRDGFLLDGENTSWRTF